jgi:hypothetical protein
MLDITFTRTHLRASAVTAAIAFLALCAIAGNHMAASKHYLPDSCYKSGVENQCLAEWEAGR